MAISSDYHPAILHPRQLREWWVLPVFMVFGGLIGLVFSLFLSPVYEAVFTVTTNFEISPTKEITEIMLDGAINHVGELVFHPEVLTDLMEAEKEHGNLLSLEKLRQITTVERRLTSTLIKVKWEDPIIAARIANTWGEIFFQLLEKGYEQALIVDNLSAYQSTMETCLLEDSEGSPSGSFCGLDEVALQAEIERISLIIAEASFKSLGLSTNLNVSQYTPAEVPQRPLYYSRGSLILAGAAIGFLVAVLFLETKYAPKKPGIDQAYQ